MCSLTRLKWSDIRIYLSALQLVILFINIGITYLGPDIKFHVVLDFDPFNFSWKMTKTEFFVWAQLHLYLHMVFLTMDFLVPEELFCKPLCSYVSLKAIGVNTLRLFFTLFEFTLLFQNWTPELVSEYGTLAFNSVLRIFSGLLDLALFTHAGLWFIPRILEKVGFEF